MKRMISVKFLEKEALVEVNAFGEVEFIIPELEMRLSPNGQVFLGVGPIPISDTPRESNPIGFLWPKEESRLVLPSQVKKNA